MRSCPLLKLPTIADPAHVSDVMYVLRVIQVTKPIISSRIIRFQVEQTNNIVALAVFLCLFRSFRSNKLNFNTTEAPFQTETWPSPSQLTFMTVDNEKSFTQTLTYTSSNIHGIRKSICTSIHVFKKIYLAFSIENLMLKRCFRRNSEVFTAFLRYPHCQIMTSFVGYLGTSNITNPQASC